MSEEPGRVAAPTTTQEQNLRTAGQRRVNMIWEYTQASIAILVISIFAVTALREKTIDPFTAGIVGVVIGFYFGRTNHARIGDTPQQSGPVDARRFIPDQLDDR